MPLLGLFKKKGLCPQTKSYLFQKYPTTLRSLYLTAKQTERWGNLGII